MFWVWFYFITASIFKTLTDYKDTVVVVPAGYRKSAILQCFYDIIVIQRKFQLCRIVVTPLILYKTEPGETFVWIDMQIFRNFHLNPSFFSSTPLLNKGACCICWSRDRKCSSNMACTYFRVLFQACDGRRRGDPNNFEHVRGKFH